MANKKIDLFFNHILLPRGLKFFFQCNFPEADVDQSILVTMHNMLKKANTESLIRLLHEEQSDLGLFGLHIVFLYELFGSDT